MPFLFFVTSVTLVTEGYTSAYSVPTTISLLESHLTCYGDDSEYIYFVGPEWGIGGVIRWQSTQLCEGNELSASGRVVLTEGFISNLSVIFPFLCYVTKLS